MNSPVMDKTLRVLVILALIALGLFRLVRYLRMGMRRQVTTVPPTAGVLLPPPPIAEPPVTASTNSAPVRFVAALKGVLAFLVANLILWLALLAWPALAGIPLIWRLFVGIFSNFYLVTYARTLAARQKAKTSTGNPVSG